MTIQNPYSDDGKFTAIDRFTVLDDELRRMRSVFDGWVRAGRMKRANYEHRVGAMESILEGLRAEMLAEQGQKCQWVGGTHTMACSSCGASYEFRTQERPACRNGHA